jgi:hypothetical protein
MLGMHIKDIYSAVPFYMQNCPDSKPSSWVASSEVLPRPVQLFKLAFSRALRSVSSHRCRARLTEPNLGLPSWPSYSMSSYNAKRLS